MFPKSLINEFYWWLLFYEIKSNSFFKDFKSVANSLSITANFKPVNWRHTRILQRQHPFEEPDYRNIQAYDEVRITKTIPHTPTHLRRRLRLRTTFNKNKKFLDYFYNLKITSKKEIIISKLYSINVKFTFLIFFFW